jgi:hypothetical protein
MVVPTPLAGHCNGFGDCLATFRNMLVFLYKTRCVLSMGSTVAGDLALALKIN